MKYRREIQEDGESKLRLITSTSKVPDVISYLKKKDPNEKNTDIPADIIVTDLNSASKEYAKWVKASLKKKSPEGDDDADPEKVEATDLELSNLSFY